MTVSYPATHDCSRYPRMSDGTCPACRAALKPGWLMPHTSMVVAAKTPGVAVLLSLLWFGAGHLYANRTATGIIFMIVEAFLGCLALTGVGLIVAIPVWLVLAPIVAVLSAQATGDYNRRNGLTLR